ncbi:MAG: N-acetylmuramoyl-L-alanine amidase [Mangrovibacterium sp.]
MVCNQAETLNRDVHEIIIHCSATKQGLHFTAADIDVWHREQGWNAIGYHLVILLNGGVELGRKLNVIGAHCYGHNAHSVGVCYIGGLDALGQAADTRTDAQRLSLQRVLFCLRRRFPHATVHKHSEFSAKACPSF